MKKADIFGRFYRMSIASTWLITGICVYLIYHLGFDIVLSAIWFKLSSLGITLAIIYKRKKSEFCKYLNLDIKVPTLLAIAGILDFSVFLMLTVITTV